jgi:hypothetical protein
MNNEARHCEERSDKAIQEQKSLNQTFTLLPTSVLKCPARDKTLVET